MISGMHTFNVVDNHPQDFALADLISLINY